MNQMLHVDDLGHHCDTQPPLFRELTVDETRSVAGGPAPVGAAVAAVAREAGKAAVAAAVGAYVGSKVGGNNKGGDTNVIITNTDCRPAQ